MTPVILELISSETDESPGTTPQVFNRKKLLMMITLLPPLQIIIHIQTNSRIGSPSLTPPFILNKCPIRNFSSFSCDKRPSFYMLF